MSAFHVYNFHHGGGRASKSVSVSSNSYTAILIPSLMG